MKLLNKFNRVNIAVTVVVLLVTGVVYYFTIRSILTNQIDNDLVLEESEIFSAIKKNHQLPDIYESNHQQIIFTPMGQTPVPRHYVDTTYKDSDNLEMEAGRGLISSVYVNGQNHQIYIVQSKVETEDLIQIIFFITIGVIVILLAALILLNRIILRRLWQPFYDMLSQLKAFSPVLHPQVNSIPSNIDEFNELDTAVVSMAARVKLDYENLKAFTENASHELMTPVSVINSKLDTLLQTGEFTDPQSKLLGDIYGTVARLTRLNKSMLLLSKIENRLIHDEIDVDLGKLIEECLYLYEELTQQKKITVQINGNNEIVYASKLLMEILLNNLISNAIKHSPSGGEIFIDLNEKSLKVTNAGDQPVDFDCMLKRFQKSDQSDGIGLGLTLCKQICDNYNFTFHYDYSNLGHTFIVTFNHPSTKVNL